MKPKQLILVFAAIAIIVLVLSYIISAVAFDQEPTILAPGNTSSNATIPEMS